MIPVGPSGHRSTNRYTRENCQFSHESLRKLVPEALRPIPPDMIFRFYDHCMRILDAYENGETYGTKEFCDHIYKGHRQIVDKSKW